MREARQLGWLDANVFVHPLFGNDPQKARCDAWLGALMKGSAVAWLDPVTVHELTYVLPRALPESFPSRGDVADYILGFLSLDSMLCEDKDALIATVRLWAESGGQFGDARLLALARRRGMPVCTVNARHFPGVDIAPDL